MDVWSECSSDVHIPHQKEPRHQYTNSDNRPDITLFDSETGQNLDVDVSLAHPWSQDILKRASREEKKMNKYAGQFLPCGSKCVPLVFEHFGRWGLQADTFLCHLSKILQQNLFAMTNNSRHFGERFSTTLQRCNARVVLKKLSRLSDTKIDTDKLFDFDIQGQVH